jgi:hypothetical protein
MTALTARRRGVDNWTPAKISSVLAWWSADDVLGSPGDSIASWTDRVSGISAVQAATAKQPTLVANSDGSGHQALRFTAANSQILTAARGVIPAQGPFWVWIVHKMVTAPDDGVPFEVAVAGVTNKGWGLHYTGQNVKFTLWGVVDLTIGSGGEPIGAMSWRAAAYDPITAQAETISRNYVPKFDSFHFTSQAAAGATTISIGSSLAHPTYSVDSEILQILVGVTAPATADMAKFADWLRRRFGLFTGRGLNATASVALSGKNNDGTTSSGAIELGVIYNASGVFGHNYWMVFDPFTSRSNVNENPHVAHSDDGNAWTTITPQPLVAYPGGGNAGNNADGDMLDNTSRDGKLYVYFTRENGLAANNGVFVISTSDGSTWTSPVQMFDGSVGKLFEMPVVSYDPATSKYWLYVLDLTAGVMYRRTSSSPDSGWSAAVACSLTIPGGRKYWHGSHPVFINGKWVMAFTDQDTLRNLWLASSPDGATWTTTEKPVILVGFGSNWDITSPYRAAIADAGDGQNFFLWYVNWSILLSQKVTVPITEIP